MYVHIHARTHTHINVRIVFFLWLRETAYNPQRSRQIVADPAAIEFTKFRQRQHRQLPIAQHRRSIHATETVPINTVPKAGTTRLKLTFSTSVYAHSVPWHRETRKQTNTLHLRWRIGLLHADLNRACSHSGCDKNCQKLIRQWLSTTAQRIESSGYGYAMYSEWSISYPDETDTDVNNPLIVLISALVLPFIYTLRREPRHAGTNEGKRACLNTRIQAHRQRDMRILNCFDCDYL